MSSRNKRHYVETSETGRRTKSKYYCDDDSLKGSSGGSKTGSLKSVKNQKKKLYVDDDYFIVEKITGHKLKDDKNFYKVHWQGYDENEDSWEPEENLTNVIDLIEEYFKSCETGSCSSSMGRRVKGVGKYKYVPATDLVASKTKYFDDVRDGKIDLTKNDLYSRVKTRKRLDEKWDNKSVYNGNEMDMNLYLKDVSRDKSMENSNSTSSISEQSENKFYSASNADEITNDYTDRFDELLEDDEKEWGKDVEELSQPEVPKVIKKKTNNLLPDEMIVYNYSSSPQTTIAESLNGVDLDDDDYRGELLRDKTYDNDVGASVSRKFKCIPRKADIGINTADFRTQSRGIQTNPVRIYEETAVKSKTGNHNTNGSLAAILFHLEAEKNQMPKLNGVVTSDKTLFDMYSRLIIYRKNPLESEKTNDPGNSDNDEELLSNRLPFYEPDSILGTVENLEELRTAIELNRYNIIKKSLCNPNRPIELNWNRAYPDNKLTPIQLCVQRNRVNILQLLLQCTHAARGDETASLNYRKESPLVMAAELGRTACVHVLLNTAIYKCVEKKLDRKDAKSDGGIQEVDVATSMMRSLDWALLEATRFNRYSCVMFLLNFGAGLRDFDSLEVPQTCYDLNTRISHTVLEYHFNFMESVHQHIKLHLLRMNLRANHLLFPMRWISVLEPHFEIQFRLSKSHLTAGLTPLLFLIHGHKDDADAPSVMSSRMSLYHLWSSNGPCAVTSVILNSRYNQVSISEKMFVTSFWPIIYSNTEKNTLRINMELSSDFLRQPQTRIAVVALYVSQLPKPPEFVPTKPTRP